jgi:hypothetical protein
MDIENIGQ